MRTIGRMTLHSAALALLGLGLVEPVEAKIGLGARFGDVILEGVQPGRTYNLREAAKVPFGIENRGDAETEVIVEFARPMKAELSENYEHAPDLSWFKAMPERMRIPAKGLGFFDLIMTVPDDPKLAGRHFQVMLNARSNGGLFGVMVTNRIRVSMGPGPNSLKAEKKTKAMQQLDFDVTPQTLYLTGVPVGRVYDSRKEAKKALRVANFAADELEVLLSLEKWDSRFTMPEGYQAIPDVSWIRMKKSTVTVGSDEIVQAGLMVEVPDKPEYKGKRWAVMVRTGLTTGFWLDAPVKVLLETAP
ncbi:MAG: hypothetical protein AAB036_04565 [Elusimicrobiota bacterium]